MKLPTITFRKQELKPGSEEWISVRDEIYKALEEYGSFEAILDGLPTQRLYEKLIKEVFTLPLDTKFENSQNLTGYSKNDDMLPLLERLKLLDVLTPGAIESFSKIIWPDREEQEFCDLVHSYAKRISEFDEMVRRMIFEKLGIEKYFEEQTRSTNCALGFMKYRVPKAEETKIGLPPHTDGNISTILSQHQVSGLQFMNKNGQWLTVEYSSPDSYIFHVNDCLKALTNGRLPAPYHRVLVGNQERYSIGFRTGPKEGYIIKVPEELVDEDHPLLYKPFEGVKYFGYAISMLRQDDKGHGAKWTSKRFTVKEDDSAVRELIRVQDEEGKLTQQESKSQSYREKE